MRKLGIIGAMQEEVETLLSAMEKTKETTRAGSTFYEGTLEGKPVVVVRCGVGKVNAALCVQILCDCFGVDAVVNTGIAGSLSAKLDIGDLVISENAMYHDFSCTVFGYDAGQVPGMPKLYCADAELVKLATQAAEKINPGHSCIGTVASGDQFVCEQEQKEGIIHKTGALCAEMEGAAIAHAAFRNDVPFVIIRAISDKADDTADMDYPTFERLAAHRCAAVITEFVKSL